MLLILIPFSNRHHLYLQIHLSGTLFPHLRHLVYLSLCFGSQLKCHPRGGGGMIWVMFHGRHSLRTFEAYNLCSYTIIVVSPTRMLAPRWQEPCSFLLVIIFPALAENLAHSSCLFIQSTNMRTTHYRDKSAEGLRSYPDHLGTTLVVGIPSLILLLEKCDLQTKF